VGQVHRYPPMYLSKCQILKYCMNPISANICAINLGFLGKFKAFNHIYRVLAILFEVFHFLLLTLCFSIHFQLFNFLKPEQK
jgi:hypothetical protein